jgi:hypothetical protein
MSNERTTVTILLALAILPALGCATYVNLPPHDSDVAIHVPNESNTLAVQGAALRALKQDWPKGQPTQVLPYAGTSQANSHQVAVSAGQPFFFASEPASDVPTIEIRQVRIRGTRAAVDIARPSIPTDAQSTLQLITVHLDWSVMTGWQSRRLRVWRVALQDALPVSHEINP